MKSKNGLASLLQATLLLAFTTPVWAVNNGYSSTFNATLTNFAVGIAEDARASALAEFIAPIVDTGGQSDGQYKNYNTKEAFLTYETARSGGNRTMIDFSATDPYYTCRPNGLGIVTDEDEINRDSRCREKKIKTLINTQTRSWEVKTFDLVRAAVAAVGGVGDWSDPAVDPIAQMDAQILDITTDCGGTMPNAMIMPLTVWNTVRNHPLVKARVVGLTAAVSMDQFRGMLLNPAIEVKLGTMSYDTKKKGVAATKAQVLAADVFIFFRSQSPDTMDLSAFKTFSTTGTLAAAVRSYERNGTETVDFVDWNAYPQLTASIAIKRITVT